MGPYRLLLRLGAGGMGEVWSALREESELPIALKVARAEGGSRTMEMMIDEARAALSLEHPNIVRTYELGHDGELGYLAMELVAGPAISLVLQAAQRQRTPIPPRLVAYLGHRVAAALHYAHVEARHAGQNLRLIHRDVTPHNILVDTDGRVLLSDFGVARTDIQQHQTGTGVIRGKPAYMSPEQAHERSIDHRSDLFSLGIVLYEMATLRRLFGRGSMMASLQAVAEVEAVPIQQLVPGFPLPLAKVIARTLEKDRELRYSSAQELGDDLRTIERGLGGPPDGAAALGAWLGGVFERGAFDRSKLSAAAGTITTPDATHSERTHPQPARSNPSLTRALPSGPSASALGPPTVSMRNELTWPTLDLSGAFELPQIPVGATILSLPPPTGTAPRMRSPSEGPPSPRSFRERPAPPPKPRVPLVLKLLAGLAVIIVGGFGLARFRQVEAEPAPSTVALELRPSSPGNPDPGSPARVTSPARGVRASAELEAPGESKEAPRRGAPPDQVPEATLVRWVHAGDTAALKQALQSGTSVRRPLAGGDRSLLHEAVRERQHAVVELILELGGDPNLPVGAEGLRPLHVAALQGDERMVRLLVDKGAALEGRDTRGDTPLSRAASIGGHTSAEATLALLQLGASVNAAGQGNRTPLMQAVLNQDQVCLLALLQHSPKLELASADGATALWYAAQLGRLAAVEALLKAGARQVPNRAGVSPRAAALEGGHLDVVAQLDGHGRAPTEAKVVLDSNELPMNEVADPSKIPVLEPGTQP